jgi:hypothetical protein
VSQLRLWICYSVTRDQVGRELSGLRLFLLLETFLRGRGFDTKAKPRALHADALQRPANRALPMKAAVAHGNIERERYFLLPMFPILVPSSGLFARPDRRFSENKKYSVVRGCCKAFVRDL